MKYQLVADNQIEEQAIKSHLTIKPLFDPFLPLLQARSIMAGVRMGIFEVMANKNYTVIELAQELSLDAECLKYMLRLLVGAGYIILNNNKYSLTELTQATLLSDSPMKLSGWVEFNYIQWETISKLEEVLKTGKGVNLHQNLVSSDKWRIYQQAMLETARPAAPAIASLIPIKKNAVKMLDIGGAHGLYGAMICRQHPPMRSEVLDLPGATTHASKLAQAEKIDDVVSFRTGDALKENLGSDYDAVFLGNIVHHFTSEQNQALFKRIKAALNSEGTIAIWDFKHPEPDAAPDLVGDGLALFFQIGSATNCYTSLEYTRWLELAGFIDIQIHPTPTPANILVTGRVA